ncbi:LPO_1073/Vpar_1526 family protein [Aquincola sp. J276]|uniref:LPO_1073/Vpar_1526 family protein n=1 Tax=Aquincola sp. J276 TaxID=2898432 RepID=UPI00215155AF|nr:LPO_1073/Vpar_1526 family protein [Aquincola sp. J276]MCR5864683.1 hypothetical protein [Aquincola sp. J276]
MTLLGKTQGQAVGSNSTALQAGRDIHHHQGVTHADVLSTCQFLIEHNFPRLQEAARLEAEKNVRDFATKISEDLRKEAATVLVQRFSDPDVQATMYDAVKACARKGAAASPELLSKLLVHRMEDNTPFLDTVLSEAVIVAPKLSKSQIAYLGYLFIMRSMKVRNASFAALERLATGVLPIVQPGLGLSGPQKLHLGYAGATSTNSFAGGNIYDSLFETYNHSLGTKTVDELRGSLSMFCPVFNSLLQHAESSEVFQTSLTSVGYAIAITLVKPVMNLDFSTWLG